MLREDPELADLHADILGERADALRELDSAQADSLSGPVCQVYARPVRAAVEADKASARALYVALFREEIVNCYAGLSEREFRKWTRINANNRVCHSERSEESRLERPRRSSMGLGR